MNTQFHKGVTVEHDLKGLAIGKVTLIYKGIVPPPPGADHFEIECEVYKVGDVFSVHSVCPRCRHAQWIDGRNKKVEYDARSNKLYVEPFQCPWELGGDDDHHSFGFGLCQLKLAFDGKVVKDA